MRFPQSRAARKMCSTALVLHGLLVAALALAGCTSFSLGNENETDVRIVDLKISADGPFGWVDNETFVVAMETGERYVRKDGVTVPIKRVATINYRTGERKFFGRISSDLCFANGYVSYLFDERSFGGDLIAFYGELGKEVTRSIKPGELYFDRGSGTSCRPWTDRPRKPDWVKGSSVVRPLSPYVGLINCNVAATTFHTKHVKARFHKPDDQVGVELPFSCYEVFTSLIYYPFKDAYFGLEFDFRSPWPIDRDRRIFWLYPDGRTETQVLAYSEIIRHKLIATARGIMAFSRATSRDGEYWIYLIRADGVKRLLPGDGRAVTSPDGCRVAVLHDPDHRARRWRTSSQTTLKVMELCGWSHRIRGGGMSEEQLDLVA